MSSACSSCMQRYSCSCTWQHQFQQHVPFPAAACHSPPIMSWHLHLCKGSMPTSYLYLCAEHSRQFMTVQVHAGILCSCSGMRANLSSVCKVYVRHEIQPWCCFMLSDAMSACGESSPAFGKLGSTFATFLGGGASFGGGAASSATLASRVSSQLIIANDLSMSFSFNGCRV